VHSYTQTHHFFAKKNSIIDKHLLVSITDLEGKIHYASEALLILSGYNKNELIGKHSSFLKHEDEQHLCLHRLFENLKSDESWVAETRNCKKNGEFFWVDVITEPLYDESGSKKGYLSIGDNITDKKRIEFLSMTDTLTQLYNRRQFDDILRSQLQKTKFLNQTIGLVIIDIDYFKQYNDYYGHPKGDEVLSSIGSVLRSMSVKGTEFAFRLGGEEFALIVFSMSFDAFLDYVNTVMKRVRDLNIPHNANTISDTLTVSIGAVLSGSHYGDYDLDALYAKADELLYRAKKSGRNRFFVNTFEAKESENISNIDDLTKLPMRKHLDTILSSSHQERLLILINLNHYTYIHSHYGAAISDAILIEKAKMYRRIIQGNEATLFRLNINEFAILVYDEPLFETYILKAKHYILEQTLCQIEHLSAEEIVVSQVIGVAMGTKNLLGKADIALKHANKHKLSFYLYDDMNDTTFKSEKVHFKNIALYKDALENNRIIPFFQPIVHAKTGELYKYEALARIVMEDGAIIPPQNFLKAAKEDRSYEYFTRQIFQKIFNVYENNPGISLSLNISYGNIASHETLLYIQNRLERCGGENITFEIIESEEIEDYRVIQKFIDMIRTYGATIAIDDFGTGYSNLAHLMQLSPDFLKLDGSLIQNINQDIKAQQIIKSLLSYTQNTYSKMIAEHVSSKIVAQKAIELGMDFLQGYHFGKPQPVEFYGLKKTF
jgi:c-di-GMP phosphodiesterase